jgi:hypothetical protein
MKHSTLLLAFILIAITFTSCKSEKEKKVQQLTDQYVRLVDSITNKNTNDAMANWPSTDLYYQKKTREINVELDKLEDNHDYDAKVDSAIAKYVSYRRSIFQQKLKAQGSSNQ